jgi:hypothetical protein
MTCAQLGRLYRVHASTISRWLSATREAILDTRRHLAEALAMQHGEVESLLGLSGSLDLSLSSLLRSEGGATEPSGR